MVMNMYKSIWNLDYKKLPSLDGDKEVDVLIVGAGITGIMTSYYLRNSNLNVMVIDRNKVCSGISRYTTGKITYLQELIYQKISSNKRLDYYNSQKDAIKLILDSIDENKIDCDLESAKSYVFMYNPKSYKSFNKEINFFKENNIPYKVEKDLPVSFPCNYAISVDDTYAFHPIKYLYKILDICLDNGIKFYENTTALDIKRKDNYYFVPTDKGEIKAKYVVLACHYPSFIYPYFFPFKTKLEKSYIVSSSSKNKHFSAITDNYPTHSIRYYKDNIIYLSNSNSMIKNIDDNKNYKDISSKFKKYFNKDVEDFWTNYDILTKDSLPIVGYLKENLLISTGYNTWGMTNGVLGAKVVSDLILNNDNKYVSLFNPKRKNNLSSIINIVSFNLSNISSFILSYFYAPRCKKNNNKICPHMKCRLLWNKKNKTYDCPCHGSIFDDKDILKGPSKKYFK